MNDLTLLLEIGCEELPTSFLDAALEQLKTLGPEELTRARISHGAVHVVGTPRRLGLVVEDVATEVSAREEELLGPPESAARTADGAWSKAAEGFARKSEVPVESLSLVDTPKGRYLRAVKHHAGGASKDALPGVLHAICKRIAFAKSMRWGDRETPFGRPIQWIVALHGESVVDFEFAGVHAGRHSRGHRFLSPANILLPSADGYFNTLREAKVDVIPDARRKVLLAGLHEAARQEGGVLVEDAFLEREVLGLVERPHTVVGHFEGAFLSLPDALIESVMRNHQRYFAVRTEEGKLMPLFLTVTNTALDTATIRRGNERVMRARLSDARFFVEQDKKSTLAARVESLDAVVFHAKLGSYGDKVRRVTALARTLAPILGVDADAAAQAATLSKADLVTLTVGEFPELQGVMGCYLAQHDGLDASVCTAIAEHYQPRGASDDVAPSAMGAVVALADRLDTLVGCMAVGLRPTGSEDPFGLRRVAIGTLRTLLQHGAHVSLRALTAEAWKGYTDPAVTRPLRAAKPLDTDVAALQTAVADFLAERLRGMLEEAHGRDLVAACMAAGRDNPVDVQARVRGLATFWATPAAADLAVAFRRVFNISREAPSGEPDASKLTLPAEVALAEAFTATRSQIASLVERGGFVEALDLVASSWRAPVDRFFTEVFVMDKDPELRDARLRLLGRMADAVGVIARFDALDEK